MSVASEKWAHFKVHRCMGTEHLSVPVSYIYDYNSKKKLVKNQEYQVFWSKKKESPSEFLKREKKHIFIKHLNGQPQNIAGWYPATFLLVKDSKEQLLASLEEKRAHVPTQKALPPSPAHVNNQRKTGGENKPVVQKDKPKVVAQARAQGNKRNIIALRSNLHVLRNLFEADTPRVEKETGSVQKLQKKSNGDTPENSEKARQKKTRRAEPAQKQEEGRGVPPEDSESIEKAKRKKIKPADKPAPKQEEGREERAENTKPVKKKKNETGELKTAVAKSVLKKTEVRKESKTEVSKESKTEVSKHFKETEEADIEKTKAENKTGVDSTAQKKTEAGEDKTDDDNHSENGPDSPPAGSKLDAKDNIESDTAEPDVLISQEKTKDGEPKSPKSTAGSDKESSIHIDEDSDTEDSTKSDILPKSTGKNRVKRVKPSSGLEDGSDSEVDANSDSSLSSEGSFESFTSDIPVDVYQSLKLKYENCKKKLLEEQGRVAHLTIKNQNLKKEIKNLEKEVKTYAERLQASTMKTSGKGKRQAANDAESASDPKKPRVARPFRELTDLQLQSLIRINKKNKGARGDGKFVKRAVDLLWSHKDLYHRSVTGEKCVNRKGSVARPQCTPVKMEYLNDLVRARIAAEENKEGDERTDADREAERERLSKTPKYVKEKICWLRSKPEPSSSSDEVEEQDEEQDEGKEAEDL